MLTGILNINKRPGMGSPAVVGAVKRRLKRGTKVGHAGTLDQFASGVLLVLVGRSATRLSNHLMEMPKQYVATIRLGATTPTDDPDTSPVLTPDALPPSRTDILSSLMSQEGLIAQVPPTYSALKIGGLRASDRTRLGETVQMQPRTVRIDRIELIHYSWPELVIRVDCGRGTYIRSIARDVGNQLGVGGYVTQLQRTRVGTFALADAIDIDDLHSHNIASRLIPPDAVESRTGGDTSLADHEMRKKMIDADESNG